MGLSLFITKVRFDDLHVVSLLSSSLKGPSQLALEFAIHATDYLIFTRDLPLIFYPRDPPMDKEILTDEMDVEGATDAAFRSFQSSQTQQGTGRKMNLESNSGMVAASFKRSTGAINCVVSDSELSSRVEGGKRHPGNIYREKIWDLLLTDNTALLDNVRTFKTSRKQRHVLRNIHFLRQACLHLLNIHHHA